MGLQRHFSQPGPDTYRLDRPEGLEDAAWAAVDDPLQRLNRVLRNDDLPLLIGSAKELIEATAKVVLEARGEPVPSKEGLPKLLVQAQAALDRQPGQGLATDSTIRDIAQGALKIGNCLGPLRNRYGTGHGRSEAPDVAEELAQVSIDAAMLWTRWALRRLRHVILGRPENLIHDLRHTTFYRGDVAQRLQAVQLAELDEANQSLLGVAVARRAMTGTFLVMDEGVERCAQTRDFIEWPEAYRVGLLNGLLLNAEGQFDTNPWAVKQIALLAVSFTDPGAILSEVAEKAWHASLSPRMDSDESQQEVLSASQRQLGCRAPRRPAGIISESGCCAPSNAATPRAGLVGLPEYFVSPKNRALAGRQEAPMSAGVLASWLPHGLEQAHQPRCARLRRLG